MMGEGCFRINVHTEKKYRLGYAIRPFVNIGNTDVEFLKPIKEWCHQNEIVCSNTLTHEYPSTNQRGNYVLIVESYKNVERLFTLLFPYLVGKKRVVASVILEFIDKFKRHSRHSGLTIEQERARFLEAMSYFDRVSEFNRQGIRHNRKKYSRAFFIKKWVAKEL